MRMLSGPRVGSTKSLRPSLTLVGFQSTIPVMGLTFLQMLKSPRNGMTRRTVIGSRLLFATLHVTRHPVVVNGNGTQLCVSMSTLH